MRGVESTQSVLTLAATVQVRFAASVSRVLYLPLEELTERFHGPGEGCREQFTIVPSVRNKNAEDVSALLHFVRQEAGLLALYPEITFVASDGDDGAVRGRGCAFVDPASAG